MIFSSKLLATLAITASTQDWLLSCVIIICYTNFLRQVLDLIIGSLYIFCLDIHYLQLLLHCSIYHFRIFSKYLNVEVYWNHVLYQANEEEYLLFFEVCVASYQNVYRHKSFSISINFSIVIVWRYNVYNFII